MKKFGFIGVGNMAQSIIRGFIESGKIKAQQIWVSGRTETKVCKVQNKWGVGTFSCNEDLADHCDVIFLCMKPQDLHAAVDSLNSSLHKEHIVISLAAGISMTSLEGGISATKQIVRIMTNISVGIKEAVIGYVLPEGMSYLESMVVEWFSPLGLVLPLEEGEMFEAFTVGTSSGIGFFFEQMIYWQEWFEEHGFSEHVAKEMTIQTLLGAAKLAASNDQLSLTELQDQVVSEKGVTLAGLNAMRELELNRVLRVSFEKAVLRSRELGGMNK